MEIWEDLKQRFNEILDCNVTDLLLMLFNNTYYSVKGTEVNPWKIVSMYFL
jgi:hypothetical protein